MVLNYIWTGFFLIGFVAALGQWLFLGDVEVFKRVVDGTFDSCHFRFQMGGFLYLSGYGL